MVTSWKIAVWGAEAILSRMHRTPCSVCREQAMSTTLSWDGESSRLHRAKADGPRKKTTVVLLKTQIALGVLGMPTVFSNGADQGNDCEHVNSIPVPCSLMIDETH
jgi:hypothetical protein